MVLTYWAGMGDALQNMAGWYTDEEIGMLLQDVAFLFAGMQGRGQPRTEQSRGPYWMHGGYAGNSHMHLGRGGLPTTYFVRPSGDYDTDHNAHHWAAFFATGYNIEAGSAKVINEWREHEDDQLDHGQVDYSDILMGSMGAEMGISLKQSGSLTGISDLLYSSLCWIP